MSHIYARPELPFAFEVPDEVQIIKEELNKNSMIVFGNPRWQARRGDDFDPYHFNLAWGPMSGTKPNVPLFWTQIGRFEITTPDGNLEGLVAGPGRLLVNLLRFLLFGLFVWSIAYLLGGTVFAWIATGVVSLGLLGFALITSTPQVKYTFLYRETEFVFTANPRSNKLVAEVVFPSIEFAGVPISHRPGLGLPDVRKDTTVTYKQAGAASITGILIMLPLLTALVLVAELLASHGLRPLAILLYAVGIYQSIKTIVAIFSMYINRFELGDEERVDLWMRIAQVTGASLVFTISFTLLCRQGFLMTGGGFSGAEVDVWHWIRWGIANLADSLFLDLPSIMGWDISNIVPLATWSQHLTMVYRAWQELIILSTVLGIWGIIRRSHRWSGRTVVSSQRRSGKAGQQLEGRSARAKLFRIVMVLVFWCVFGVVCRFLFLSSGGFMPSGTDLSAWMRFSFSNFLETALVDAPQIYGWIISDIRAVAIWTQLIVFVCRVISQLFIMDSLFDLLE